jgi:protein SCO1/2
MRLAGLSGDDRPRLAALAICCFMLAPAPAARGQHARHEGHEPKPAGPRWLFLTGGTEEVVSVRKAFDAYPGDNKMRHQPLTFIRLSPGRPWLRLDGLTSAAQLAGEYERLTRQ